MRRALLAAALVAACGAEGQDGHAEPRPGVGTQRSAIVRGAASGDDQDSTVLVMHYDALALGGGAASGCTGSLLAPNLVLTARHCVSTTDPGAACNSKGQPISGGAVKSDHAPSAIFVFGGKTRPDFLSGEVKPSRGTEILTTGASTLCNNDIALIVVDSPVFGATITPIRLEAKPAAGERVTVIGWGISDAEPNPRARLQRTGVSVVAVGPAELLGPAEFKVDEGTCQGDSGGPAVAASGAVLGALSRGGTGSGEGAEGCLGAVNIFTSVAAHADFVRTGYAKVGQPPWLEGEPNPLLAPPPTADEADGGCSVASRDPRSGAAFAASTLAVLLAWRRRKKRI